MLVRGTTSTGFEYEVDRVILEDAEFLELFADVQNGGQDGMKIFALIRTALGNEQKKRLYDHCRAEDGHVPVNVLSDEIAEIFTKLGEAPETKN